MKFKCSVLLLDSYFNVHAISGSLSFLNHGVNRVSQAVAGRNVTVAVVRPSIDPYDVELGYKRAAFADASNADVLRQFETFALEYDKFGRGDLLLSEECTVCVGGHLCETCYLYRKYANELKLMPTALGSRKRSLNDISDYLLKPRYPNVELPPLPVKNRTSAWKLRKDTMRWGLDPRNWISYALQESDREHALKLNPIELYEDVKEELGLRENVQQDDFEVKYLEKQRNLARKKMRGKGVFATSRSLGAKPKAVADEGFIPNIRSPYPRTIVQKNEDALKVFINANQTQSTSFAKLIKDEERKAIDEKFFGGYTT